MEICAVKCSFLFISALNECASSRDTMVFHRAWNTFLPFLVSSPKTDIQKYGENEVQAEAAIWE